MASEYLASFTRTETVSYSSAPKLKRRLFIPHFNSAIVYWLNAKDLQAESHYLALITTTSHSVAMEIEKPEHPKGPWTKLQHKVPPVIRLQLI